MNDDESTEIIYFKVLKSISIPEQRELVQMPLISFRFYSSGGFLVHIAYLYENLHTCI